MLLSVFLRLVTEGVAIVVVVVAGVHCLMGARFVVTGAVGGSVALICGVGCYWSR